MQKRFSNRTKGIALLCAGAALISFPFLQTAMQGSISHGSMIKINATELQMDSVDIFYGGGFGGGGATTFRDMSNNMVSASSGFAPLSALFSSAPKTAQQPVVLNQAAREPLPVSTADSRYDGAQGSETFPSFSENGVQSVAASPVSTFSIDVDTASYGFLRRTLAAGGRASPESVRVEELVNYFPYSYPLPESKEEPFRPAVAVFKSPWNDAKKIVHIGIKGYDLATRPKSNFVFLIDTSGSMQTPDKLELVVRSLKLMLDHLSPDDTVGIVTYAGQAGVALEPVKVKQKSRIIQVLDRLNAGGSTAGGAGIEAAYELAERAKIEGGNNRVILATDGDFNVGISQSAHLKKFIETKRDKGIFLSVLGYGIGNYRDNMMQALADAGDGNAAYIADIDDARKALVEQAASTLFTIAKDVKIQVEFNPAAVQDYRLVGYETRALKREDFDNDRVDAGEVGAGHSVTAIYEITPAGSPVVAGIGQLPKSTKLGATEELAFLQIRYKHPEGASSKLLTRPITRRDEKPLDALPDDVRFATAVAGFGQLLKKSPHVAALEWDEIIDMANNARGKDEYGYRTEFVNLLRQAKAEEGK